MMNATKEICLTKIRQRSWGTWQVQRINPRPSGRLRISGKVRISLRGGKGGSRGGCNAETAILWSVCSVCPTTLTLPFSSTASPPLSLFNFIPKFPQVYHASFLTRGARLGSSLLSHAFRVSADTGPNVFVHRVVGWISRKSPRASIGPTRRRCLPPTRRVLLNHGQPPREERGTNKGLLYLHRGFERWLRHVW